MAIAIPDADLKLWPLSLEQWHRMLEGGLIGEDDRVEFLEGFIVEMAPPLPQHQSPIDVLTLHFGGRGGQGWFVRVQGPVTLAEQVSEPQPDVVVVPGTFRHTTHPSEALLVVEVSVTTQRYDRGRKAGVYARAAFPEYWLVDVPARRVEVYTRPEDGAYRDLHTAGPGEELVPTLVDVPPLPVARLFP